MRADSLWGAAAETLPIISPGRSRLWPQGQCCPQSLGLAGRDLSSDKGCAFTWAGLLGPSPGQARPVEHLESVSISARWAGSWRGEGGTERGQGWGGGWVGAGTEHPGPWGQQSWPVTGPLARREPRTHPGRGCSRPTGRAGRPARRRRPRPPPAACGTRGTRTAPPGQTPASGGSAPGREAGREGPPASLGQRAASPLWARDGIAKNRNKGESGGRHPQSAGEKLIGAVQSRTGTSRHTPRNQPHRPSWVMTAGGTETEKDYPGAGGGDLCSGDRESVPEVRVGSAAQPCECA